MVDFQLGSTFLDSARGTAFRVWASNASSVSVSATFNNWSDTANPLTKDGDYWSGVISNETGLFFIFVKPFNTF